MVRRRGGRCRRPARLGDLFTVDAVSDMPGWWEYPPLGEELGQLASLGYRLQEFTMFWIPILAWNLCIAGLMQAARDSKRP